MCLHYAPRAPAACLEEDAIEVSDKVTSNFCDYFVPNPNAFTGAELAAETDARERLDALFGSADSSDPNDGPKAAEPGTDNNSGNTALREADALFKT